MAAESAWGLPVKGSDATGQDAYAELVAAPGGNREYSHFLCWNTGTNAVTLSFDAGSTDHLDIPGSGTVAMDGMHITEAIHSKNETGAPNYTGLYAAAW